VVVYLHGGGWVLGSTRGYDPLCTFIARAVDAVVVSVGYRMAPEHRAPVAVHDCVDSVRWLPEHAAALGGDASHLAVAGDSAGGNLAAIVCQVVRDDGGPAISHQALLYPSTDATKSQPSIQEHARGPVLTLAKIDAFLDLYLGPDGLAPADPLVSPLWAASHADLPPALVQTADLDPLRDEGRRYAERLAAAGVPVRHTNYVGAPHGFASFPGATTIGWQHRVELVTELRRYLHPTPRRA
jgi:acetyl esterase